MLDTHENGYSVMDKELTSYSYSGDLQTCKRYCRNGDVIAEQISCVEGFSVRITWYKYWRNPIYFKKRYREANIFYLHFNWNKEYMHKTGKIVYKSQIR